MQKRIVNNIDEYIEARENKEPGFKQAVQKESQKLDIAIKIRDLREREGLSQRELAERLGKPQSTIARIENGNVNPSFKTIEEIANKLGKHLQIRFV
ncbi:XRE family transcriptional regulator [Oenococcus oeni IOEB_8417]|uniref:helix-turn-helix domain-containing protein n=1 Tax=Oenococcus oeni TaxID=1247 RepID=UPI00050DDBC9|nr:helix-turn-helix transcriptional regulator [Oenococcus oeni]KGH58608.1 XRE family transcriptional regulator [Oenococcus oeni IOEB_9805]KGH75238.1 XRE family transcriptional regulator [Oenococcus oeni IOEB_9803]KGH77179.1 XRE family transcriptional regulator [Oenococcus oeni IOEB_8417]